MPLFRISPWSTRCRIAERPLADRQRIRQAFSQLPAKYRLVATLALLEDEPYEKIAAATGISVALVKVRVFRAVRALRKKLLSMGVEISRET